MSLLDHLYQDMKEALRAGQKTRLGVIRMTISAIKKAAMDKGTDLSEVEEIEVVQRGLRQRRESAEAFTKGNRPALVQQEEDEAVILTAYLPAQLTDEQLDEAVKESMRDTGATTSRDMGKVMGRLLAKYKGHVEGDRARQAVQKALGGA